MKNIFTQPITIIVGIYKQTTGRLLQTVVCVAFCACGMQGNSQPALQWAKSMGGSSTDFGLSLAADGSGNVYTTGRFNSVADFDPGAGTYNLTTAGGDDIFISKLDASGNFLWAGRMGGTGADYGYGLNLDAAGNLYVAGYFRDVADFDPGAGIYNLTSAGNNDIFISKVDAAGNFLWARRMGGTAWEYALSVLTDPSGNVYSTGYYNGTADFDPGGGSYNLTTAGGNDIFVSKLSSTGSFVWARKMGGTGNDQGNSIARDGGGNIYTTGYFNNVADFDPGAGTSNLTSAGANDVFVSKLDASGTHVWAVRMGGSSADRATSVATDGSGNVYVAGLFSGTADFDPGGGTYNLTSLGLSDVFVTKLSSSGGLVWAFNVGSTADDYAQSIALDASGNIFVMGDTYSASVDLDPGAAVYNVDNTGVEANFIAQYDNSGNFACGFSITPGHNETLYDRHLAVSGSTVWTTGTFDNSSADFDPCSPVYNATAYSFPDIFVARYDMSSCSCALPVELVDFTGRNDGNKITLQWQTASERNNSHFAVERSTNGTEFTGIVTVQGAGNSLTPRYYEFTDSYYSLPSTQVPNTLYYRLKQEDYDGQSEYSHVIAVPVQTGNLLEVSHLSFSGEGTLSLVVTAPADIDLSLQLFDVTGQKVLEKKIGMIKEGGNLISVHAPSLPAGVYGLVLRSGSESLVSGRMLLY